MSNREKRRSMRGPSKHQVRRANGTFLGASAILLMLCACLRIMAPVSPYAFSDPPLLQRHSSNVDAFYQKNISSARIVRRDERRYIVDVAMLVSDFVQIVRNLHSANSNNDLIKFGISESEIARFFLSHIALRDGQGMQCPGNVARLGEEPVHEGVWATMTFECDKEDAVYDATRLLVAQGARAWQVVAVTEGGHRRQVLINAENPRIPVATIK